ncbi:MAG: hypothetical protein UY05_C0063G0012, partial [Candidatus Peregrinibacteria bacterium GW2011_GWA2_47_7]
MNFLISLIILGFLAFGALFLFFVHVQKVRFDRRQKHTVIEVQVAKGDDKAPGPIAAEQLFSTVHGIAQEGSFFDLFTGRRKPRVSFEICHTNKKIKFYIWFPSYLKNLIEGQIYAHYPTVEIREVPDYTAQDMIEIQEQEKAAARGLITRDDLADVRK